MDAGLSTVSAGIFVEEDAGPPQCDDAGAQLPWRNPSGCRDRAVLHPLSPQPAGARGVTGFVARLPCARPLDRMELQESVQLPVSRLGITLARALTLGSVSLPGSSETAGRQLAPQIQSAAHADIPAQAKWTNCAKSSKVWHRLLAGAPTTWPCTAALNAGRLANIVDAALFEKCREPIRVHLRHRGQQEVRIWVMGWREHLFLRALFHNLAILHDHNLVGD